jgi:hypothetical protein
VCCFIIGLVVLIGTFCFELVNLLEGPGGPIEVLECEFGYLEVFDRLLKYWNVQKTDETLSNFA